MNNTMNFDIHALIQPKTEADIFAILEEVQCELKNFSNNWTAVNIACAQEKSFA